MGAHFSHSQIYEILGSRLSNTVIVHHPRSRYSLCGQLKHKETQCRTHRRPCRRRARKPTDVKCRPIIKFLLDHPRTSFRKKRYAMLRNVHNGRRDSAQCGRESRGQATQLDEAIPP
jgi:hypothetical protein